MLPLLISMAFGATPVHPLPSQHPDTAQIIATSENSEGGTTSTPPKDKRVEPRRDRNNTTDNSETQPVSPRGNDRTEPVKPKSIKGSGG
jgi:hypothetical protein